MSRVKVCFLRENTKFCGIHSGMPQDIVLFAQTEHSLPVRDTFAQQKREGGDGGKADTLMDRVGGENIHTGGNHGECGGELVENRGLQPLHGRRSF